MQRLSVLLLALTACAPALQAASAQAALDCGAGLLALSQPDAPDYIRAAGCAARAVSTCERLSR